jgi:hypothetical protein
MILLFEKATISATSVAADSSGLNLDFWIIPAANLITISATQDKIILYFRDGNPYSETLATGEALTGSFRFSTVTFNVTTGKEAEVAKNFYKFILAGPKPIVPIPSVRQIFTFSNVTNEFADIADITSIDTIKRYTSYDTITGSGGGGLPPGTADGEILQWDTTSGDWILSAYTLPTADGTTGQILTTDGAGAVTFEDAPKGKFSFVISYRYYLATANYYIGNSTYGINNTPTYAIASTASCTNVDAFNGGIVIPFKLSNVGFKVYGYSSGSTRTVSFDLLKGTLPASGGLKTDSISLTTVASNSGFSMTSSTEMYEISATSTNTVDPGDFLLIAFSGSTSSYYYFTITIYGDT